MKTYQIIAVVSFLFFSCKDKEIKSPPFVEEELQSTTGLYTTYFNDEKKVKNLSDKIIFKGDTLAYRELYYIYALSGHKEEYLYMSLIMANKYGYNQAYYDVYSNLYRINRYIDVVKDESKENLDVLDKETRVLAFKYLEKAANKGHLYAKKSLMLYDKNGNRLIK